VRSAHAHANTENRTTFTANSAPWPGS
jgi:hypothetical protein